MRLRWLLVSLVLVTALAVTHVYAIDHLWYWHHRWFDIPMHILGGMVMATAIIGVLGYRPKSLLFFVAAGAFGWELFEYLTHISTGQPDYVFDTIKDIVDDFIGATLVYVAARITSWR